ncbi:MAG: asparagine synthase C-terminal domain-containing protein, partial [Candidatus Bilamarchaeaceae archaeon]
HEAPLATKKLERIIEAGVAQSCEADVPLGVLLSGGIDSTLVSYLAKKNGGQITNAFFLFTGKNDDELKIVERIAEDISLKLNVVDINDRDFLHYLKNISKNSGEILTNVSFALNALLTKQANKKKIKVLLSGAGGDEIFFGYPPVNWFYILNNYNPFIKLIRHPIGYVKEYGIEGYKEYYRKIMEENVISRFDVAYVVDSEFDLSRTINVKGYVHPLKIHALFSLLSLNSHSVVMAGDLGGMANSVEIRAPLLHYDIISNAFGYRTTDFLDFFTSKKVLKDMLKKTELSYVLNLKKTGFGHQMMLNQILEGMEDELKEANEILHRLFPHLKISNTPKNKLMALQFKNIVDIIEYRSL